MNSVGVLEILYALSNGFNKGRIQESHNGKNIELTNIKYLLNQTLRQITLPKGLK